MTNNNNYSVFAKRLLQKREEKGLSRTELGEKIGFTGIQGNKNVHKYEHDVAKPGYDVLVKIAEVLECSVDYLLGATDNPNKFIGDVKNAHYEVVISENEKDKPYSKEQFEKLIEKLESIGFDVNKLIND